jgi:hypothetical protein
MPWWTWVLVPLTVLPSAAAVWLSVALGLRLEERRAADRWPAPAEPPRLLDDVWEPEHDTRLVAVEGRGRSPAAAALAACRRAKLVVGR